MYCFVAQENVGGTTYFYPASSNPTGASGSGGVNGGGGVVGSDAGVHAGLVGHVSQAHEFVPRPGK